VTANKKTMYEILGISPTASQAEIKAAHERLSIEVMSGSSGLDREDCNFRLNLLDVALHTLSTPVLRDAYDAQLASANAPAKVALPAKSSLVAVGDQATALKIAAAIEDNYKIAVAAASPQFPIETVSSAVGASTRAVGTLIRVIIVLVIMGLLLKAGLTLAAFRRPEIPPSAIALAEEKLIIQQYYQKYGVRPASKEEAIFLEEERRRRENEQHEAEFERKKTEEEYHRFIEESRNEGDRIHRNLVREEERLHYEEMQRQRELDEEKRMKEEEEQERERARVEYERRKLGLN
jgi:hypothetical protein